jgi:predicted  nucleic acid-binding Zn-ribbon protein
VSAELNALKREHETARQRARAARQAVASAKAEVDAAADDVRAETKRVARVRANLETVRKQAADEAANRGRAEQV